METEWWESLSTWAAAAWGHLIIWGQILEYYNFHHDYDVILWRLGTPIYVAAGVSVLAFVIAVLRGVKQGRVKWRWGLRLMLIVLPAYYLREQTLEFLTERNVYLLDLLL